MACWKLIRNPARTGSSTGTSSCGPDSAGAEPGRHRPGDGGDGEHTAEHPDAGDGPLARRADPHPVHQQAAEGLPRHGGHGEEGDAEQSHGEGLGEDEEGADAAGQRRSTAESCRSRTAGRIRARPARPLGSASGNDRHHHQSGAEADDGGGDSVAERRPEGAVDPALDRDEQARPRRPWAGPRCSGSRGVWVIGATLGQASLLV